MATLIELNDSGIQVFQQGRLLTTSPGYAVLDGDKLLIGDSGAKNSRRLPRWTNNKYWNQLGTDAIANGTASVRHHADLAFAHLEEISSLLGEDKGQVVFAVPGFYSKDQLALLLGMANECQLPVSGLVDLSLVSVATPGPHPLILHLDIHLHRVVLSVFRNEGLLRRAESITIAESGLFTLWDRWANIIADQFIQGSRFDPMYQAESEQTLYDSLPAWIKQLEGVNRQFDLAHNNANYSVVISPDQLLSACASLYPQIIQAIRAQVPASGSARLCISHRFSGFPGLKDSLALLTNLEQEFLPADAVAIGVEANLAEIVQEGQVTYVTSLPLTATPDHRLSASAKLKPEVDTEKQSRQQAGQRGNQKGPTHLLFNHHAIAIGQSLKVGGGSDGQIIVDSDNPAFTLAYDGQTLQLEPRLPEAVQINDTPARSRTELRTGDNIAINSTVMTIISVDQYGP